MSIFRLPNKKLWLAFFAFLALLGFTAASTLAAPMSSAAAPREIVSYVVSGPYVKNVDEAHYKVGYYIPEGKPNGTYLGGTTLKQDFMDGLVTFKTKVTRANSSRLNVVMTESPFVSHAINADDTQRWITITARSVRLGSKWKLVDDRTGKAYFWKVPGKAFKFQAKFDYTYEVYDGDNDVWNTTDKGTFTTPVQTVAWVKKKPKK